MAGGHASGPLVCPPPRIVARNGRGISDSMATTHMQNGTGQLESKLVEDQVPLRCPTVLPTCHRACPCPPGNLVHFCKIVVEVIWSSHFVSQVTWSTIFANPGNLVPLCAKPGNLVHFREFDQVTWT